ncbi:Protein translocase subunit YajC [hydrothermal vent metagenome]|uniref:Protein translocase subunit YajC n=1 Tax=hydrothermal vent metagenome TaxID=652676 RepID=A0A3B0ZS58_9ZZZZ
MEFFISDAMAQGGTGAESSGFMGFIPLIIIFIIFYWLLMRPQMKRAKEHRQMLSTLSKNDEVVTSGGILGRVIKLDDNFVSMEIAEGVRVKVQRNAVASLLPKGSIKEDHSKKKDDQKNKNIKLEKQND